MTTIVIQTAIPKEQKAVLDKLPNYERFEHPITGTEYMIGEYISNENKLRIVVGRTNQTNINSGIETERIIQQFNPSHIFFVGIAGGRKDVKIGDVVIGSDVLGFERGKDSVDFLPRPQFAFSSYELDVKAINFSNSDEWLTLANSISNPNFKNDVSVFSGTIASGEKVIADSTSSVSKFLNINGSHVLAVEMEGLGFLEACRPYPLIKSLLIRGISDLIDGKSEVEEKGSHEYASKTATEFIFGFIDYLNITETFIPISLKEKLLEITTKLYPEGLKDQEIWIRSGGDLALIQLNTSGKSQWVNALRKIENGGGGNITFDSLIIEMKVDFPNNQSLKFL